MIEAQAKATHDLTIAHAEADLKIARSVAMPCRRTVRSVQGSAGGADAAKATGAARADDACTAAKDACR